MTSMSLRTKLDKWGNPDSFAVAGARDQKPVPLRPIVAVLVVNPFASEAECRVFNEVQRLVYDGYRLVVLSAAKRKDRSAEPTLAADVYAIAYADHIEPPIEYQKLPRVARQQPQK